ncbi:MAG: selenocysteine-specific translation elongation factor [Rubrivivax sp.]
MIVGTAGHIDHGKTTLVAALTGVNTDRLPEEQKRGISIELGYAFLAVPGQAERIGFIDVPGHERLVHTMLAGATGIDFALLLVAADDGVMPQTREHLAVLSLLGLQRGAVVVTKADRADAQRVASVVAEAQALLAGTALAGSPVFVVSATTGQGLDTLRQALFDAAAEVRRTVDEAAAFRLAVDRAFTLDGVGTVVTGTVHAGRVAVGDELVLVPGEQRARVRSLHAQNRAVQKAQAGQRCAVGLVGVAKDSIDRGQWLVAPAAALATQRIDTTLALWHGETRPLRSGTTVHVHLGSATVMASVAVLAVDPPARADAGADVDDEAQSLASSSEAPGSDQLQPGQSGVVQLVLHQPVAAWWGDRVVLRDASASRTLAGGAVLDPVAPVRYRRTPQRLAELAALRAGSADQRAQALLAVAPQGLDLQRFSAAQGLTAPVAAPALALVAGGLALAQGHGQALEAAVLAALANYHAQHDEELGPDAARLRRLAAPRLPEALWRAVLERLRAAGQLALRGAFVHLPAHGVRLSASEERIAQKVAPWLMNAGFEGAWARDLAKHTAEPEPLMRTTLARLAQRGELHQVVRDLYYPLPRMQELATIARSVAAAHDGVVLAATFRDATQLGRKRAIQILEHFDRVGLLRRVGDLHKLRADATLFLAEAGAEPTAQAAAVAGG